MEPSLDPEIAGWLATRDEVAADPFDVAAVREVVTRYMAESGGAAPRLPDPAVTLCQGEIAGIDTLQWSPAHDCPRGTVVAVHGGGFIVGDPLGAEPIAVPLARDHGIRTVAVRYRRAPEHRYPAAVDDVRAVLDSVEGPCALWGDSAGGAIAVAAAAQLGAGRLRHLTLVCPALDDRPTSEVWSPCLRVDERSAMWQHYLGDDLSARPSSAVPARMANPDALPATTILLAEHDLLRSEGLQFAARLADVGVPVTVFDVGGVVHGFTGLLAATAVAQHWNAVLAADLSIALTGRLL